ncbi:MAG: hypothetical protein KDB10_09915, partial [Acidimicrobiales bacterium]|nr:hypothetical protein [Acidimicrobiales bacterium]
VLREHRGLAVLPVLSFVANLVVLAGFLGLILLVGVDGGTGGGADGFDASPFVYVLGVFGYLAATIVTVFFQTALVSGADEALSGGEPSVGSSLHAATSRLDRILPWALLTGTVGLILQAVEERAGFVGQIVANLVGAAWRIVTFLVVPVLVVEDLGPIAATKRSAQLFRSTWGENLAAQMGFGLLGFLAALPALLVGGVAVASGNLGVAVVGVAVAVAWLAVVMTVVAALSGIFQMALYRYATSGDVPGGFPSEAVRAAFGPRRR